MTDVAGRDQTNLALKGTVGIEAMAQIASRTRHDDDAQNFTGIAHTYIEDWIDLAVAETSNEFDRPHTTLSYGMNDTYSLLYNLYADKLLGLGLVPQSVYDMQSDFYPTVFNEYGVPLDTRHSYTRIQSISSSKYNEEAEIDLFSRLGNLRCFCGRLRYQNAVYIDAGYMARSNAHQFCIHRLV